MLLDLKQILLKNQIEIKGVVQVGSHYFEERDYFLDIGAKIFMLFEPNPDAYLETVEYSKDLDVFCYNIALSDKKGKATLIIDENNQGQSSSLLKPKKHIENHPDITFKKKIKVNTDILDNYIFANHNYDLLYMDAQGSEGMIINGAKKCLKSFKVIYSEINFEEMYEGCVLKNDFDKILKSHGFICVWAGSNINGWSDAVYIRKDLVNKKDKEPTTQPTFNEGLYLQLNPDVETAVKKGILKSGLEHYEKYGQKENRRISL